MKAKKALTVVVSILLWLVILIAALLTFTTLATKNVNNVASLFGYTPLSVQTESMAPFFNAGDLIIIKKCDPMTLKEGDVITFHTIIENQYALNTHRISKIDDNGGSGVRSYTTKGDNNSIADTHIISDNDIVGKYVVKLGGVGKFVDFLASSTGFLIVIVVPMLLFFIYQIYHLITVSASLKKAMALEAAEEEAKIKSGADSVSSEALKSKEAELEAALAEAKRLNAEMQARLAGQQPPAAPETPAPPVQATAEAQAPAPETPPTSEEQ